MLQNPKQTMEELVLGCGRSNRKRMYETGETVYYSKDAVKVDINPDVKPTLVHDLNNMPWPFKDNSFDVIHAYHILEHLGSQGDYKAFLRIFEEIWRILKPNGMLRAIVPRWDSKWAWGDPGHRMVINEGSIVFLSKEKINDNIKKGTSISEYSFKGDFNIEQAGNLNDNDFGFALRALK